MKPEEKLAARLEKLYPQNAWYAITYGGHTTVDCINLSKDRGKTTYFSQCFQFPFIPQTAEDWQELEAKVIQVFNTIIAPLGKADK